MSKDLSIILSRRAFFLGSAKALLTTGLLGRLYWLQIASTDHYKALSDKNRLHAEIILPLRGQILDQKGNLVAGNQFVHCAYLHRDHEKEWKNSLLKAAEILNLTSEDIENILDESTKKNKLIPLAIKDYLSWEDVAKLELNLPDLPGVTVEQEYNRFYPYALEMSHVLGYIGKPSLKDLEETNDPFTQQPRYRHGKSGIEKLYENHLKGSPGLREVEVNSLRQIVREISVSTPANGPDLTTSLDLNLQKKIYELLEPFHSASSVVMDIQTGAIKALVSVPGFDNNYFVNSIPQSVWKELQENPYHPLLAKFVQGQYAPGSTFKMVVALAALQEGVITPERTFSCPGHFDHQNHRYHCWQHDGGHGSVNLKQAIARSCDVYFYNTALLTGVDAIAAMAKKLGLGEKTLLNFPFEKAGLIPTKDWKRRIQRREWTPSETINTSIGQGYVLSTPLQLCLMASRLASKKAVSPIFIKDDIVDFEILDIENRHLDIVLGGMRDVMQDPQGTAFGSRSPLPNVEFAGKTGTSQVRRITKHDRELNLHKSWPWHWRDHAVFVGFAPFHDPKYAVAVVIEHGGSGGKIAAPIGRDILTFALSL